MHRALGKQDIFASIKILSYQSQLHSRIKENMSIVAKGHWLFTIEPIFHAICPLGDNYAMNSASISVRINDIDAGAFAYFGAVHFIGKTSRMKDIAFKLTVLKNDKNLR